MDVVHDAVWVLDVDRFGTKLLGALESGNAVLHDGVAYWAQGSGKTGIIQHLPFKEVAREQANEMLKQTVMAAAGVSTGVLLAAMVVQTQYLAGKLDTIQSKVDVIGKDQLAQILLQYADRVGGYVGRVEAARSWLRDPSLIEEIRNSSAAWLMELAGRRNQLLSHARTAWELAGREDAVSQQHHNAIANFALHVLEVVPIGVHMEYLMACRSGYPRLGEQILLDGGSSVAKVEHVVQAAIKKARQKFISGDSGDTSAVYAAIRMRADAVLSDPHRKYLTELPNGRMASAPADYALEAQ